MSKTRTKSNITDKKDTTIERLKIKHERKIKRLNQTLNEKDQIINKSNTKISQLNKIIHQLKEDGKDQKKIIKKLEREKKNNEKIIADQNRRLDYFENAHVPSSKQGPFQENNSNNGNKSKTKKPTDKKSNESDKSEPRKTNRGGIKGHKVTPTYSNPQNTGDMWQLDVEDVAV